MDAWLRRTVDAIAHAAGVDPSSVEMTDEDARLLLAAARIASHDSGDRTNAPLLCYLIGRLAERVPATAISDIHGIVASRAHADPTAD